MISDFLCLLFVVMRSNLSWTILTFVLAVRAAPERDDSVATTTSSSALGKIRKLIVDGEDADPRANQFFVRSGSVILCGASLIHSDIILTAAHCQGAFNYDVVLYDGPTNGFNRWLTVDSQRRYPDFNISRFRLNYDVLVLRLAEPIYDITPVVLNSDPSVPVVGQQLTAVGFGRLEYDDPSLPEKLQEANFVYLSKETCIERYTIDNNIRGMDFNGDDYLCVDPEDKSSVCSGDSGGPLITSDGKLVGINSFGVDCLTDDIPDGFARVSYFYNWIQEQICELSTNPPADCPAPNPPDPNAARLRLVFFYDYFSHEITFSIRNKVTGGIVYAGPQYVPSRGESVESFLTLPPGEYTMEVYDSGKNGLDCSEESMADFCSLYPDGGWFLYASYPPDTSSKEVEVARGDAYFLSMQRTNFVIERPDLPPSPPPLGGGDGAAQKSSSIPSDMPSFTPSLQPSIYPSQREDRWSTAPSNAPSPMLSSSIGPSMFMV